MIWSSFYNILVAINTIQYETYSSHTYMYNGVAFNPKLFFKVCWIAFYFKNISFNITRTQHAAGNVGHFIKKKQSRCVCEILCPCDNKIQKAIFSFKIKVKVTRSLTFISFERVSLVEYACQIWCLYLLRFKSYSES